MGSLSRVYEVSASPARILPMEGIRGLAALLVFMVHFQGIFGPHLPPGSLAARLLLYAGTIGHAGVDLFFVLSGYLIYGMLLRKETPYFSFIRRRAQRIYPPFLMVLALYLALSAFFPEQSKIHGPLSAKVVYVVQNVLLLPGFLDIRPIITVTWSLSLIWFFYLIMPVVVSVGRMRVWQPRERVVFLAVAWGAHLMTSVLVPGMKPRVAEFAAGALLLEVVRSRWLRNLLRGWAQGVAAVAFLLGISLLMGSHSSVPSGSNLGSPVAIGPGTVSAVSVGCLLLVLVTCNVEGWLSRAFSWAPIRWLGNMSYSYFLIHGLALKGVEYFMGQLGLQRMGVTFVFLVLLPAGFAATWCSATILFLLAERQTFIGVWRPPEPEKGVAEPA